MKKDKAVTVRFTEEVASKLKQYAQNNSISQSEFLSNLINNYEVSTNIYNNSKINIFLNYENFFLKDKDKQIRIPKKYIFLGQTIYISYNNLRASAKFYEKELKDDFKIEEDLDNYEFYYNVGVYNDTEKNRFVILEVIVLYQKGTTLYKLNVNRCKFAYNLSEILSYIRRYAKIEDINAIQNILAEPVIDDEDVESFLF